MNWKYKAWLKRIFSALPQGEGWEYALQRYVTRSLPIQKETLAIIASLAKEYLDKYQQYTGRSPTEATFYEFGTGWDLAIPLSFYIFGVERQILVDIRRLVRPSLVNSSIKNFQEMQEELQSIRKPQVFMQQKEKYGLDTELSRSYGIEYRAPSDARQTGLESCLIDCITSTSTLEHIPPQDIAAILRECHRLLRDGGVMISHIDYSDHYSHGDNNISPLNFLQYSEKDWAFWSPDLLYQNRLRHPDYLSLFQEAGFEILEESCKDVTRKEVEQLQKLSIHPSFNRYSLAELTIRNSRTVLRK